ncbi:hypothetical protein RN001_013813 [Aquatica leii]|uniref:Uncharacterized protein n=1 Tax=Aquatica leii TaxID=1421715 RepID=A0AAN7SLR7_9COLE|nr:hypothetical protein RN001_013813 [Aquatica leii]
MLENCAKLSVLAFEPIEAELPIIDPNKLSTDQKYLFAICKGISRCDISSSLSLRDPGKMSHSRWLTTANQIFKLYVATIEPSMELKTLAKYNIVDPILQRNAYFGHPENILLAMLADERKYVRKVGLRRILKCRRRASNVPDNISILKLPCHTQAVERCIRLVTEASSSVCGNEARDGLIRAKLASRSELPKFETKKQFINVLK